MSDLLNSPPQVPGNRRSFFQNLALASAAAGIVALPRTANAQTTSLDIDILNFALNLEFLEAEFYTAAATGQNISAFGITVTGSGTGGATTGGSAVTFTVPAVQQLAEELAVNERYHVVLLQNTITLLGGTPIAKPAINLNALGIGFGSQAEFLTLARVFEEIGVTAYGGAANQISNTTVLGYAARILATEAEHVGFIRALIYQYAIPTMALDYVDVPPPPSGTQFFSTNSDEITAVRTPGQVLYLAYATKDASKGGFFPAGVNGAITASTGPVVTDGSIFTLTPNPSTGTGGYSTVTVAWAAPGSVTAIEIRIGTPNGPLFTQNLPSGTMTTGAWVTDGMLFYLQDITPPKMAGSASATLAVAIARVNSIT